MKPVVGSMMPEMQASPPARPMISREISSLCPLPKVWTTPPWATEAPTTGAKAASAAALVCRARARSSAARS